MINGEEEKRHSESSETTVSSSGNNENGSVPENKDETNEKLNDVMKSLSGTTEDLAEEKRSKRNNTSLNVDGTIYGNQNNTQNNTNAQNILNIYSDKHSNPKEVMEMFSALSSKDKTYDLTNRNDVVAFGEKYKAGEHLASAIILSVFEYIMLDDLHDLKSKLLQKLDKVVDEEGNEITVQQNSYLATDSLIKIVSGKFFEEPRSGEKCVGLGESRPTVLRNLWEQFPSIRVCIAKWLLSVSDTFEYRTSFETAQIVKAFVHIMKLDFTAGERHIFERLRSDERKLWLLSAIALKLHDDTDCEKRILPMLNSWIYSSGHWLWKVSYYVYAYSERGSICDTFETSMSKLIKSKIEKLLGYLEYGSCGFTIGDVVYISQFLIYSERARTLLSQILGELAKKHKDYGHKQLLALIYLAILREGYFRVSKKYSALPLIVYDTKQQLLGISPLPSIVLQSYETKREFLLILGAYLKEASDYTLDDATIKRIKAFFIVLLRDNARHSYDIKAMLKRCNCRLADSIANEIKTKINSGGLQ